MLVRKKGHITNQRLYAGPQMAPYSCNSLLVKIWFRSLICLLGLDGHQMDQSSLCRRPTPQGQKEPPRKKKRNEDHCCK